MGYTNALSAYKETRVKTAGQGQLIIMLYDGAVKQLDQGLALLGKIPPGKRDPSKIEEVSKAILKAQEIITELMVSLDFEQGGEVAKNLFSLYTWFNRELVEANISRDTKRIVNVRNMVDDLRLAWGEVVTKGSVETEAMPRNGINIAG